ncbi:hypothetical protein [uncultured Roseobacter sp.]|uniref:hypothetical protein n=1 Tax=uncultured Roseobacter sp. TaxID=114847 RepID=UPI00344DA187
MPINFQFIEATDPDLARKAPELLKSWGQYQIIRTIADGLAFVAMFKPVKRRAKTQTPCWLRHSASFSKPNADYRKKPPPTKKDRYHEKTDLLPA